HHLARIRQQRLAGFGERDVVEVAREQLAADFFFELLDALADRGLRTRDALRRPREGTLFNDREKVFELEKIHNDPPLSGSAALPPNDRRVRIRWNCPGQIR